MNDKQENSLTLRKVDYANIAHIDCLTSLLQGYAKDPMGGGQAISDLVIAELPNALASRPYMHSFIVYEGDKALAFANCIESFSTFSAKGLMNIHDFAVVAEARGKGVSQFLLAGIESFAKSIDCTKMTLEVLQGNASAIRAYEKWGFGAYQLDPEMGSAMFWQKSIA
jgi:GNAT superfamily N-acetyltransferase